MKLKIGTMISLVIIIITLVACQNNDDERPKAIQTDHADISAFSYNGELALKGKIGPMPVSGYPDIAWVIFRRDDSLSFKYTTVDTICHGLDVRMHVGSGPNSIAVDNNGILIQVAWQDSLTIDTILHLDSIDGHYENARSYIAKDSLLLIVYRNEQREHRVYKVLPDGTARIVATLPPEFEATSISRDGPLCQYK